MVYRVIIVEDEVHSAKMLESMIYKLRPDWTIQGVFDSVSDTVDWLQTNEQPHVIFLDIQLSDGIGFSIFEKVKINSGVIFTTAYDEYAIRAFQLNSVDYLQKPVKEVELLKSIEKYERIIQLLDVGNKQEVDYAKILSGLKSNSKNYRKRFLVNKRESFYSVTVDEIAYIYFESKLVYIVTKNQNEYVVNYTLDRLEEELDPDEFFRANRQVILHLNTIQSLENYFGGKLKVKLLPQFDKKIIISRAKATAFKNWLDR